MSKRGQWLIACACGALLAVQAQAADKKAEGDLRWALNYCGKVVADMDKQQGKTLTSSSLAGALKRWQGDHAKYVDYLAKAKAADASVTESSTVYDKKSGQTFAQAHQRCLKVEGEMQAFAAKLDALRAAEQAGKDAQAQANADVDAKEKAAQQDKVAAYEARKAGERAQWEADENKRLALEAAKSAIWGECSGFKGFSGSSNIDERLASYEASKKQAVSLLPDIVKESVTVDLKATREGQPVSTTKTVGEWFTYCDSMMPAHVAELRQGEAAYAAKEKQENEARKAADDKIRAEQAAKFKALVAATGGDRKRILQSKGFLPWWPRSGELKTAPVWKWEINITHQATRCETFQFSGDKLTKNFSELGACP